MPIKAFEVLNPGIVNLNRFNDAVSARIVLQEGLYVALGKAVIYNRDGATQKVAAN